MERNGSDVPEFLDVTMYVDDIGPIRSFYHEVLRIPIVHEEPGHIAVMGPIAVHDPTEGPVGTTRFFSSSTILKSSRKELPGSGGQPGTMMSS